jgi:hypothetical protein
MSFFPSFDLIANRSPELACVEQRIAFSILQSFPIIIGKRQSNIALHELTKLIQHVRQT